MMIAHPQTATAEAIRTGIIDCDVHPSPRSVDKIRGYMPMPWRDRYSGGGRGGWLDQMRALIGRGTE